MSRIRRAVAQRARGFGVRVLYQNRNRLPPELEAGATAMPAQAIGTLILRGPSLVGPRWVWPLAKMKARKRKAESGKWDHGNFLNECSKCVTIAGT
jgi:hypothetical protein